MPLTSSDPGIPSKQVGLIRHGEHAECLPSPAGQRVKPNTGAGASNRLTAGTSSGSLKQRSHADLSDNESAQLLLMSVWFCQL